MVKICLIVLACLAYTSIASNVKRQTTSTCPDSALTTLQTCVEGVFTTGKADKKTYDEAEAACYKTYDCKPEECEEEGEKKEGEKKEGEEKEPRSTHAPPSAEEIAKWNQTRECFKIVGPLMEANVATCVKTATGFSFPSGPHPHGHHGKGGKKGDKKEEGKKEGDKKEEGKKEEGKKEGDKKEEGKKEEGKKEEGKKGWEFKEYEKVKKSCAKSTTANALNLTLQCLNTTREANFPQFKAFCVAKNSCMDAFTATAGCSKKDIEEAEKKVKEAAKTCMNTTASIETLALGVTQCAGVTFPKKEEHHKEEHHHGSPPTGPPPTGAPETAEEKKEHEKKEKEEKERHEEEERRDPCEFFTGKFDHKESPK